MIANRSACSWWPFLIAILLLGIMGRALFGGLTALMEYRNSVDNDFPLTTDNLHFFTKEYIERLYTKITAEFFDVESELPAFRFFVDEQDWESLNSDLPMSGKSRFVPGHVNVTTPSLYSDVQLRYRGGLPLHWLYDKKSLRIKLPPYTTYLGDRQFNLVNPSTLPTVTDWVSYDMARSLGLLTPDYFPVRVYINNVTNGLHYYLSRIDESLLRKNHRMPGSIYSGDTINLNDPLGMGMDSDEVTYKNEDGFPLLWTDERLWAKDASRNVESTKDRSDIKKFLDIINYSEPLTFMQEFEAYFEKEKYYTFWGVDTLLGAYHHDNFHNHKLYFDPYKGKFEPIEWDIRFWSSIFAAKDLLETPLLKQVKLNPILEYERDKVAYGLLKRFPVSDVLQLIETASDAINDELRADPFRQAPDQFYPQFAPQKDLPFSLNQYNNSIDNLKLIYKNRHAFLEKVFEDVTVQYLLSEVGVNKLMLTFSITGNSPIEFNPWNLIPLTLTSQASIKRIYQGKEITVSNGALDKIYPGRSIVKGNVLGRADSWSIMAFGMDRLKPSALQYEYLIDGISLSDIKNLRDIEVLNAITGSSVYLQETDELLSTMDTASVHPWSFLSYSNSTEQHVVLSGEINVEEDSIFSKEQEVTILPGTNFRLSKNSSLIFYGKVMAEGTELMPIRFQQKIEGEPWGSVVIQGKEASGSQLSHIVLSGGSVTTQRLVRYPGQFNIHDVDSFKLEHCIISSNYIGDDALHIAYSKGEVRNCQFNNTAFDALDIDIAEVTVSDSEFFDIGNDALDLMTSMISIIDVSINNAGDKCISVGEDSRISIHRTKLKNCNIGIAVKDESKAYIEDIDFSFIKQDPIALYQKNPRYNKGGTVEGLRLFGITQDDINSDSGSTNLIPIQAFLQTKNTVINGAVK